MIDRVVIDDPWGGNDTVETLPDGRLFISEETAQNEPTGHLVWLLERLSNYWQRDTWLRGWVGPKEGPSNG